MTPPTFRPPIHSFRPYSLDRLVEARERREKSWIEPPAKEKKSKLVKAPAIPPGLVGLPLEVQQMIMAQLKGKK